MNCSVSSQFASSSYIFCALSHTSGNAWFPCIGCESVHSTLQRLALRDGAGVCGRMARPAAREWMAQGQRSSDGFVGNVPGRASYIGQLPRGTSLTAGREREACKSLPAGGAAKDSPIRTISPAFSKTRRRNNVSHVVSIFGLNTNPGSHRSRQRPYSLRLRLIDWFRR